MEQGGFGYRYIIPDVSVWGGTPWATFKEQIGSLQHSYL
jgi:hypothetical protein